MAQWEYESHYGPHYLGGNPRGDRHNTVDTLRNVGTPAHVKRQEDLTLFPEEEMEVGVLYVLLEEAVAPPEEGATSIIYSIQKVRSTRRPCTDL